MKYIVILISVLLFNSCTKTSKECEKITAVAPAAEVENLRTFLSSKAITATEDYRGFFYTINNEGTGTNPTSCDDVTVNYIGKYTDDSIFDQGTDVPISLPFTIIGWQAGLPLVKEGGSITLYLPPSMGYGAGLQDQSGNYIIPPNAILIFDITLSAVN